MWRHLLFLLVVAALPCVARSTGKKQPSPSQVRGTEAALLPIN